MSLGAGVIGDIYGLEERGTSIGIFFGVRDDRFNARVSVLRAESGYDLWLRCCTLSWRWVSSWVWVFIRLALVILMI
jgi:hypothetical protein